MLLTWENRTCLEFIFGQFEETFKVNNTGLYPRVRVDSADVPAVGHAGGVMLTETVRVTGLDPAVDTVTTLQRGRGGRWLARCRGTSSVAHICRSAEARQSVSSVSSSVDSSPVRLRVSRP